MDFASQLSQLQKLVASAAPEGTKSSSNKRSKLSTATDSSSRDAEYCNYRTTNDRRWNKRKRDLSSDKIKELYHELDNLATVEVGHTPMEQQNPTSVTHHITLLFLTIDDLPHEKIWRAWMEGSTTSSSGNSSIDTTTTCRSSVVVTVIAHAKFPERVRSPWLRERLLTSPGVRGQGTVSTTATGVQEPPIVTFRPEWGSIEITRAMIELLAEGVAYSRKQQEQWNPTTTTTTAPSPSDRFIFVSETCIPVVSLDTLVQEFFCGDTSSTTSSWVNGRNHPNNGYSRQLQWEKMSPAIPTQKIWKADQWIVLTRNHAEKILDIPSKLTDPQAFYQCFAQVRASDEMYFPTALAILGLIHTSNTTDKNQGSTTTTRMIGPNVQKRRITYCDWSGGAKNPVTFQDVQDLRNCISLARNEGCLLARKFSSDSITLQEWSNVIYGTTTTIGKEDGT